MLVVRDQFTAAPGKPGNATSDISSDDDSKAPRIQKKTIHMWGSPLRVIVFLARAGRETRGKAISTKAESLITREK